MLPERSLKINRGWSLVRVVRRLDMNITQLDGLRIYYLSRTIGSAEIIKVEGRKRKRGREGGDKLQAPSTINKLILRAEQNGFQLWYITFTTKGARREHHAASHGAQQ